MPTILNHLVRAVERYPERVFFHHVDGTDITYGHACVIVAHVVEQLREAGVRPGDRVVLFADETIPMGLFILGCGLAKAIPVPLSTGFSPRYFDNVVKQVETSYTFTTQNYLAALEGRGHKPFYFHRDQSPAPTDARVLRLNPALGFESAFALVRECAAQLRAQDAFVMQATSGSTGTSKLVVRPHSSLARYATLRAAHVIFPGDTEVPRILMAARLTSAMGIQWLAITIGLAAQALVPSGIDTSISLAEVQKLAPTTVSTPPRVLRALYEQAPDTDPGKLFGPSLKCYGSGGSKSDLEYTQRMADAGICIHDNYAASEASAVAVTPHGQWRPGWSGVLYPDCEVRVEADGELLVKNPGLFLGYYGAAELTAEVMTEGFYRTGDLVEVSADRWLRVLGRKADTFYTRDGQNIFPASIEALVERLPGCKQVMLVGDKRPFNGAFIATAQPVTPHDADGVLDPAAHEALYARVRASLAELNDKLENSERIAAFMLVGVPFDEAVYKEVQHAKIRRDRKAFYTTFAGRIDQLYGALPADDLRRLPRSA